MCSFCDKIFTSDEVNHTSHWDLPYDFILRDAKGAYHIYNICDDDYYSGTSVRDIHFCPKCGKALD